MEELRKILEQIKEHINYDDETALLTNGMIDSVELVELVAGIEEKFGVEVPLDEIVPENFDSMQEMWTLIQRLK